MNSQLIKSNIKLTIGILVSNSIKYIRKTMESIKPLLDNVPSELIALDTKGEETDGSIAVVREYTDKVYPFVWCNDFAKARNACLEHAVGEWFLYLDDDEWFDDVRELIEFFSGKECEEYNSGYYYTRNYTSETQYSMAIAGRMIRRRTDTHFVGKVHEVFNEVLPPHKYFSCFVHHAGYIFDSIEEKKKHQERNISIMEKEIERCGYTPRVCAQMMRELAQMEDTLKESIQFGLESIERLEKQNLMEDTYSQFLLVEIIRCCHRVDDYKELRSRANDIRESFRRSRMAELAISAIVAQGAISHGDYETTLDNVKEYMEQYDWLQNHPREANLLLQLDFPSYCTEEFYFGVLHMGAVAANKANRFQEAMTFWTRFPWKRAGFSGQKYVPDMKVTQDGIRKQKLLREESEALCKVFMEAIPTAQNLLEEKHHKEKIELLTGMQEVAISLGNKLEELYGEGMEQIPVLEQCCELIWQCANIDAKEEAERLLCEIENLIEKLWLEIFHKI